MRFALRGFLLFSFAGLADGFLIYGTGILRVVEGWIAGVANLAVIYGLLGVAVALALLGLGRLPPLRARSDRDRLLGTALAAAAAALPAVRYANHALAAGPASPLALAADALVLAALWFGPSALARRGDRAFALGVPAALLFLACAIGATVAWNSRARTAHSITRAAERTPNLLWITIDTLRADHLGCYGYARPTSPNLDAFAASAVTYDHAVAQAPWTAPSAASYLSSTYPTDHGCTARNPMLESVATLPEILRGLGYRTHMIAENPVISPSYNLTQGCDRYVQIEGGGWEERTAVRHRLRLFRRSSLYTFAATVLPEELMLPLVDPLWLTGVHMQAWVAPEGVADAVVAAFRERRAGGAFVYLHWSGPHDPYAPKPEFEAAFCAPGYAGPRWMSRIRDPYPPADLAARAPDEFRDIVDRYDAKIAQYDAEVGSLLRALEAEQLLDDAIVIVNSDHGEEFLEHGGWQHGHSLYREMLHVPLIVRLPGGAGAGSRIPEPVELVDLVPTVLDYLGCEVATAVPMRGESLLAGGALGPGGPWTFSAGDLSFDGSQGLKYCLQASPLGSSLILNMAREDSQTVERVELFDLAEDWLQLRNLWDPRSPEQDRLLREARERLSGYGADRNWAEVEAASQDQLEDIERDLREIGYVE